MTCPVCRWIATVVSLIAQAYLLNYVALQVRDPEDYRLTFRTPSNCLLNECNVFVGIDTNVGSPGYLDITMQGVAGGWLAVGFTFTQSMVSLTF